MLGEWAASVEADPTAPCAHYFGRTLSRAEVDRLSDALGAALGDRGVAGGDRVAVVLQNIPQFLVTVLATWKLGGIVVPVNPMLRERELRGLLTDSGAVAAITLQSGYAEAAAAATGTGVRLLVTTHEGDLAGELFGGLVEAPRRERSDSVLDLAELLQAYDGRRPGRRPCPPTDDDIAFLTYTSGTTGVPKGAMNTFGNVRHSAGVYRDWIGIDDRDVILAVAPLFHITGLVAHVALALLTGAPLVLTYRFSAPVVARLVELYHATFTIGSITVFIALLHEPVATPERLRSLRKVYSGGAPIPPAVIADYEQAYGVYLHNAYGLTETTSPSHLVPFGQRAPVDPTSGTLAVGVPVFGTHASVVDEHGRPAATGEAGEIVVAGPQVVPGYWQRADETTQAFPAGALHTGDIGFVDADGWYYVVDRKKDMINAAGFKVWPREVEDVLYEHPDIREAAVVGAPDGYRGETVVAFVSLRSGFDAAAVDEAALVRLCRSRLAAYKAPRRITVLDDLPKTPTGKILRRELRAVAAEAAATLPRTTAPATT